MDARTIATYNQMAREYDEETTDFWEEFPPTVIDTFADALTGTEVLDVGSGPGRDGLLLTERGLSVTCIDASQAMVDLSSARGLTSVVGDLLSLPFNTETFDGVWAYTSLLHIPKSDIPTALSEIHRVLKPGGIFMLGLVEGETEEYQLSRGVQEPRLFSMYQIPEVETLLKTHGFEAFFFEAILPRNTRYLHFVSRK
jgi:ubiquinone/menaquinone biosynthesis C-methylase UbiE